MDRRLTLLVNLREFTIILLLCIIVLLTLTLADRQTKELAWLIIPRKGVCLAVHFGTRVTVVTPVLPLVIILSWCIMPNWARPMPL